MSCFNVWVVPRIAFGEDAAMIGAGFQVPMQPTTAYDEYPAFKFDLDEDADFFVRLLGPPSNVEDLIKSQPWEFGVKDRNYWLTVCSHSGLPAPEQVRNSFPGANPVEFGRHIVEKLKRLGFSLFADEVPYTTAESGKLVHPELIE